MATPWKRLQLNASSMPSATPVAVSLRRRPAGSGTSRPWRAFSRNGTVRIVTFVPTRERLPRAEREARVLDVAHRLFYERGVHEVGMDELVRETGVGKASVYRLFPTKDALIGAHLRRLAGDDRLAAQLAVVIDGMYTNAAHLGANGPVASSRDLFQRLVER